eukprot:1195446-Prorocentrum_minimum.AAC.7
MVPLQAVVSGGERVRVGDAEPEHLRADQPVLSHGAPTNHIRQVSPANPCEAADPNHVDNKLLIVTIVKHTNVPFRTTR